MTAASEFAGLDFPLAVGEVYGLRAWRVDDFGRLRALHLDGVEPWRPGINTATCQVSERWLTPAFTMQQLLNQMVGAPAPEPKPEKPAPPRPPHPVPVEGCSCGFYAYTDPKHPELGKGAVPDVPVVLGVIRGTGRTLIGTRGFRCEKAEIVALLDPTRGGLWLTPDRVRRRRTLRRLYPEVSLLSTRLELRHFAPIEPALPDPTSDEFWSLP